MTKNALHEKYKTALEEIEARGRPSWCNKLCRIVEEYRKRCEALEEEVKLLRSKKK